jgi:alpha-N-arabinofuranosidase
VGRVYRNLLAAPEAVDRSLSALSARIAARERGRSIAIAVTEWGAFFSTDPAWVDHIKTMGTAVYLARMMQVFLGQPRVAVADYFKFTDRTMMGWVGFDQQPKIPYYVLQLYARHFGTQLVAAQIDSPTYSADGVGVIAPDPQVPEVTVAAARDESGRRLFVNLINRSGSTIHRVRLDLGPFRAGSTATGWVLSAPTPTDHNGRDLPDEVPAALYQEPPRSPGGHPIRLERTTVDLSIPVRLAPWSIVTLELGTPP